MRRFLLLLLLLVVGAASWRAWGKHLGAEDVMVYRGQRIKLSKAYGDFDEYKNDTNNILPSETERVQKLLIAAPIQHTFANRLDLFRAVGEITFPGYGTAGGGGHASDGSELLVATIEIPRAGKDRYLVFQKREGRYELIDDFVQAEASYPLEVRERDGMYVYLHGDRELFRRPKP